MSTFAFLLVGLALVTLFVLLHWLLRRHVSIAHFIFRFFISVLWSFAFIIGCWVILVVAQLVIKAHFPSVAAMLTDLGSLWVWILLGAEAVAGLLGMILGLLGRLPGTKTPSNKSLQATAMGR